MRSGKRIDEKQGRAQEPLTQTNRHDSQAGQQTTQGTTSELLRQPDAKRPAEEELSGQNAKRPVVINLDTSDVEEEDVGDEKADDDDEMWEDRISRGRAEGLRF
jgi:hypothetical protein